MYRCPNCDYQTENCNEKKCRKCGMKLESDWEAWYNAGVISAREFYDVLIDRIFHHAGAGNAECAQKAYQRAVKWFRKFAEEENDAEAKLLLGFILRHRPPGSKDQTRLG